MVVRRAARSHGSPLDGRIHAVRPTGLRGRHVYSAAMSHVFYRDTRYQPPVAVRGEGVYIIDADGKRYLDASGGAAVSSLGHNHPRIVAATKSQLDSLAFAHTGFFTSQPAERLADELIAQAPEGLARVYFVSGGSEAVEASLKIARQYFLERGEPQRRRFIARRQSYHGNTLGALSVGGNLWRREPFGPLLFEGHHIAPCYAYRYQNTDESEAEYGRRTAGDLQRAIEEIDADKIAAFIAEPVVGATLGAVPPVDGYLREIRRICDEREVLFIADEVMCGSGRTGSFFAHEQDDVLPDIVTMAKGLGGGYQPIAATLARKHVVDAIVSLPSGFEHGHTYIGHATACAAGVAVQKCLDEQKLLTKVAAMGRELFNMLQKSFGDHANVGDIRGRGLFAGIEIVADRETKEPFPAEEKLASKIKAAAMDARLICYPGAGSVDGKRGTHILIAPPFIVESKHLDELAGKLDTVFNTVFAA